jgi:ATP synthase subunit 6
LSGLLLLGIWRHGFSFIKLFIPDVPMFLYPLIIPLEMLSYIIRGFSLAIRLSANVLAGHTLTHIISDTVKLVGLINFDLAIISLVLLIGITVMELGVACLQAYIFTLLIVIYINDVYNLAH